MSCEYKNTPKCPVKNIDILRRDLGEAANGYTATTLRDTVCGGDSNTSRAADCSTYRTLKSLEASEK